ncbi:g143 [Coccomyxa elongata]
MAMMTASLTAPIATQISRPFAATSLRKSGLSARSFVLPRASNTENDSYQKLEAPVRNEVPEGIQVGPDVKDRQTEADDFFKSDAVNPDRQILNSDVGFLEMMRFKGALPEILNSRLAMLGFFWAIIAEQLSGKNVFDQVKSQPVLVATTVVLITVASAIPFYKGVRRSGNSVFTPDAELWNGRLAMLGMVAVLVNTWNRGHIL